MASKKYTIFEASDILHQVGELHNTRVHIDYGTGEKFTSGEVHLLSYVVDNPGISVTRLAHDNGKTKGAISQMIKRLESKDLIRRESSPLSDRSVLLYPTEAGLELHAAHKAYDTVDFGRAYKALIEICSAEKVNSAISVLETWLALRREMYY